MRSPQGIISFYCMFKNKKQNPLFYVSNIYTLHISMPSHALFIIIIVRCFNANLPKYKVEN